MPGAELPVLDEHRITVNADAEVAWRAVADTVAHAFTGPFATAYAWAVRCTDWRTTGPRPLAEGATVPGFRVVTARPGVALILRGQHHFSEYQLTFRLEPVADRRTLVRAESSADFPGITGPGYRLLVFGTGAHVFLLRRMLRAIKAKADG
ncbi:hypothetical protein GCM10022222_66330 [Amycolatopsis ultiminotia]|uniref:Polyketide cyclase / dehydrase and lipid transport n=1 Tax=Amycolatopsis ultiminotia TaxID=543629 RepID=A0ABP6XUL6_9PSEU